MKQLYYDVKKCLGCKSCEIACAVVHSVSKELFKALKEQVLSLPRKRVLFAKNRNYPVSCRHCEEPLCLSACMSGCISKDKTTGRVLHDEDKCVGCWMCVMVCPYGAIMPNIKSKIPVVCDKCKDKENPACVSACPTKAIIWEEK